MPRLFPNGAQQIVTRTVLDSMGLFLEQYSQRHQLTLTTETDYPQDPNPGVQFWGLLGPALAVLFLVEPIPEPMAADAPQDGLPDGVVLRLVMDPSAIKTFLADGITASDDPEQRAHLADLRQCLGPSDPVAQAQFMLAWMNFFATAAPLTCKPVQDRLDRQLERSLLLNQVVTKIQESLDLSVILQTTVSEVRHFLQADRLLIYQFSESLSDDQAELAIPCP
jgi:hypothetical protein